MRSCTSPFLRLWAFCSFKVYRRLSYTVTFPAIRSPPLQQGLHHRRQPIRHKNLCPRAKLSVCVYSFGRKTSKDDVFEYEIEEYKKRLRPVIDLTCAWFKNESKGSQTIMDLAKRGGSVICLDEVGKPLKSSLQFCSMMYNRLEEGGSRLAFVIGDEDGLPKELQAAALPHSPYQNVESLSLSPLTLTHKMTRLFLVEQIYRASEIRKGSKYHK